MLLGIHQVQKLATKENECNWKKKEIHSQEKKVRVFFALWRRFFVQASLLFRWFSFVFRFFSHFFYLPRVLRYCCCGTCKALSELLVESAAAVAHRCQNKSLFERDQTQAKWWIMAIVFVSQSEWLKRIRLCEFSALIIIRSRKMWYKLGWGGTPAFFFFFAFSFDVLN